MFCLTTQNKIIYAIFNFAEESLYSLADILNISYELLNIITSESETKESITHFIDSDKKIGFIVAYSNVDWGPEILNNVRILLCKIIFTHKYYDIIYDIPEYNVEEYVTVE